MISIGIADISSGGGSPGDAGVLGNSAGRPVSGSMPRGAHAAPGMIRSSSCPALCRASTSCSTYVKKDVDGRDKPGHDKRDSSFRQLNASFYAGVFVSQA